MLGLVFAAAAAPVAIAQPRSAEAPFPTTRSGAEVAAWLRTYTNVRPADVVVVGRDFLFATVPGGRRVASPTSEVVVREEVLAPAVASRIHARSAVMTMAVRCTERSFQMTSLAFYGEPNLGGRREVMAPSTAWVKAPPGDYVADVLSSVCDPAYGRPFAAVVASSPGQGRSYAPVVSALGAPTPSSAAPAPGVMRLTRTAPGVVAAGPTYAAPIYAGDYLVQLGAFGSPAAARNTFATLPEPERSQLARRRIDPTPVRGVTLYRAQLTGFASAAAAEAFCRRARSEGSACLARPRQRQPSR